MIDVNICTDTPNPKNPPLKWLILSAKNPLLPCSLHAQYMTTWVWNKFVLVADPQVDQLLSKYMDAFDVVLVEDHTMDVPNAIVRTILESQ